MNVQHIESLNDQIWQITGIQVRETVPDGIVRQAAAIVAVDVTPDALLNRLKRGAVYKPELVDKALTGFFKGSNLGALRELTLRQAAHEVDLRQSAYDETRAFQVPRISEARPSGTTDDQPKERILIHITADPSTAMLIRRGRRVADYLHADCTALFVHQTPELSQLPAEKRQAVEKHLCFARSLQIETRILGGSDIAKAVVEFARHNQVTQIFVAHAQVGLLGACRLIVSSRIDEYSAPNRKLHFFRSTLLAGNVSLREQQERLCGSRIRKDYYIFMTAFVDLRRATEKSFWFSNLDSFNFTSHAQAFGREPNALRQAL